MPGPSWRPFLGAFGVFLLFLGLVFGGWLLAVGVIALISTLVGWLTDAVQEYRRTVEADTTGHLDSGPTPATPSRLLAALTILTLGAAILQSSVFATGPANGGTGTAGASARRPPPPRRRRRPRRKGPALRRVRARPRAVGRRPVVPRRQRRGQGRRLRRVELDRTGGQAVHDRLLERGPGTPHNIELINGSGATVFKGDIFNGVATRTYDVTAQPAGAYTFKCIVHPSMTGTATLQ